MAAAASGSGASVSGKVTKSDVVVASVVNLGIAFMALRVVVIAIDVVE